MNKPSLIVFSKAASGRDDEYGNWYRDVHLQDMRRIDGVESASAYIHDDASPDPRWTFVAHYTLSRPAAEVLSDFGALVKAGEARLTDSIDSASVLMMEAFARPGSAAGPPVDDGFAYVFLALTNPREGAEEPFNDWYDTEHVPDVMGVDGISSGARYRLHDLAGHPLPWAYLAIYGIEHERPAQAVAELRAKVMRGEILISDTLDREGVVAGLFKRIARR